MSGVSRMSLVVVLVFCLLALSGCPPAAEAPAEPEVPEAEETGVIKIGYVAPFTGAASEFGINGWRGIQIALDEINEKGIVIDGVNYKIEIVRYDSRCEPTESAAAVHKMIMEDKVVAFLGDHCSSACMAIAALADEYQIPGITIECAATAVTNPGHPFYFRMRPDMALMVPAFADVIVKHIQPKTISFLAVNDDYGLSWVASHRAGLEERGVTVLSEAYFERGTTDFTIHLSRIKELMPDMVGYCGVTPEGAMILAQAHEFGLLPGVAFYGAEEMGTYELLELAGADVLEGTYAIVLYGKPPESLEREVEKRFGARLHYAIIFGYDALHVLADAIERAQTLIPLQQVT